MKVENDYKIGQSIFIQHDDDQQEYKLHRVCIGYKNIVALELLCPDGSLIEVPEIFCTKEKDVVRATGGTKKEAEDES